MPVLDDVADAGRRAGVVFEHQELARPVAHDVRAADVHIGAVRQVDAAHDRPVVRIAEDELGRDHPVRQDLLVVVDVVQQVVERGDALAHARLDARPVLRREHARDAVEGKDAVDRVALGIDGEGDAEVAQLRVGVRGTTLQLLQRERGEAIADRLPSAAARHLAPETAGVVAGKDWVGHRRSLTAENWRGSPLS